MANYENIKPYAEFSHKVARHGGPEKYVENVADLHEKRGFEKGYQLGLKKGMKRVSIGALALGCLCYCGKIVYGKVKHSRAIRQEELNKEINAAEKKAIQEIKEVMDDESSMGDIKENDKGEVKDETCF